jgi:hypothetical protein
MLKFDQDPPFSRRTSYGGRLICMATVSPSCQLVGVTKFRNVFRLIVGRSKVIWFVEISLRMKSAFISLAFLKLSARWGGWRSGALEKPKDCAKLNSVEFYTSIGYMLDRREKAVLSDRAGRTAPVISPFLILVPQIFHLFWEPQSDRRTLFDSL